MTYHIWCTASTRIIYSLRFKHTLTSITEFDYCHYCKRPHSRNKVRWQQHAWLRFNLVHPFELHSQFNREKKLTNIPCPVRVLCHAVPIVLVIYVFFREFIYVLQFQDMIGDAMSRTLFYNLNLYTSNNGNIHKQDSNLVSAMLLHFYIFRFMQFHLAYIHIIGCTVYTQFRSVIQRLYFDMECVLFHTLLVFLCSVVNNLCVYCYDTLTQNGLHEFQYNNINVLWFFLLSRSDSLKCATLCVCEWKLASLFINKIINEKIA